MKVIWTEEAADDFEEIVTHIKAESEDAALRVSRHVFKTIMSLPELPFRGRKRVEDNSREIIFAPWPYVAVYEVVEERIYVLAIRHTSRNRAH